MPTNLPPEYYDIEKRYKEAKTPSEKIAGLEKLLACIPKHKGTDKLRADFKKRLSKLKAAAQTKKSLGTYDSPYRIDKEGGGQVAVIGAANTGKSSLVAALTNAGPEIADFPYSTWGPTPGMAAFEDIQIQLIDTPPLSEDYTDPEMTVTKKVHKDFLENFKSARIWGKSVYEGQLAPRNRVLEDGDIVEIQI